MSLGCLSASNPNVGRGFILLCSSQLLIINLNDQTMKLWSWWPSWNRCVTWTWGASIVYIDSSGKLAIPGTSRVYSTDNFRQVPHLRPTPLACRHYARNLASIPTPNSSNRNTLLLYAYYSSSQLLCFFLCLLFLLSSVSLLLNILTTAASKASAHLRRRDPHHSRASGCN